MSQSNAQNQDIRTAMARAIWSKLREDRDQCDLELEDMQDVHPVWSYTDAALAALSIRPSQQVEQLVRFCPGCGSVGVVPDSFKDCCPDGGHARMIPESLARRCHDLFRLALVGASTAQAQQAVEADAARSRTNCDNILRKLDGLISNINEIHAARTESERNELVREANVNRQFLVQMITRTTLALTTTPAPAQPAAQPFLVRDVAEMLGVDVPNVCKTLVALGFAQKSTNMEITPDEAVAVAKAQPVQGVPERAEMALRMLEDPTPEMLESFQRGFMQQLKRRKHYKKGWEISAEQAGIRTMLETVLASIDAASTSLPAHKSPNPLDWADCLRISETPEVDEALRLFSDGETSEDQAVCIVQAVLRAAQHGETA